MKLELPSLHLECEPVAPNLWACMEPFPFLIDGRVEFIKWFFICDKYSVPPNPFYKRRRVVEKENIPAWLHDYMVRYRLYLGLSIMDCHRLFRDAMRIVGMGRVTAQIKYMAVVVGTPLFGGVGDGTPPRSVRKFIAENGWGC
jgi:hypothetical protein